MTHPGLKERGDRYRPSVRHEPGMMVNSHLGWYRCEAPDLRNGVNALDSLTALRNQLRHHLAPDRNLTPAQLADVMHVLPRIQIQINELAARVNAAVERLNQFKPGEE